MNGLGLGHTKDDYIKRKDAVRILRERIGNEYLVDAIKKLSGMNLPIKKQCTICPHCSECDVNEDGTIENDLIPPSWIIDWFYDELNLDDFEEFLESPYDPSAYVQRILEQMLKDWRKENASCD